jgi:protein-disulfide isomerase
MKTIYKEILLILLLAIPFAGCNKNFATFDGGQLSDSDVEKYAQKRIEQIKEQIDEIKKQAASELLFKKLIEKDAGGVPIQKYFSDYLNKKKSTLPESLIRNQVLVNQGATAKLTPQELEKARSQIVSDKINLYRNLLYLELMEKYHVNFSSKSSASSKDKKNVNVQNLPFRGPKDAKVTIVNFTDFQCPYCQKGFYIMKEVFDRYPGKIKWVYADFPLEFHKLAPGAANASRCAGDQNKFWEFHDLLYQKSRIQSSKDFTNIASILKLDMNAFTSCEKSNKYTKEINAAMKLGMDIGVNGTPAFIINGQFVSGAIPLTEFVEYLKAEGI